MEKITSWLWRPNQAGSQQEDSFYFMPAANDKPAKVLIARAGALPVAEDIELLNERNQSKAGYNAQWLKQALTRKNYDLLMKNMRDALDFLNVRLVGV